jgi:hypothetical protein
MRAYVIKNINNCYMTTSDFFSTSIHNATLFKDYELAECYCLNDCKIVPIEIKEIPEPIRLLPCICGSKYRQLWNTIDNSYYYKCSKCGLQTPNTKTKAKLKEIWNEMIKERMKDNK